MTNSDGWKSKEAANHYISLADVLIPYRNEILDIIATLAADNYRPGTKIIDLGCGNGELTERILKKNSQPQIIMVDYSQVMLEECKKRFSALKNISLICHDLNKGLPKTIFSEGYSVAVSCFVLHHVDIPKRLPLCSSIRQLLLNDGLFINGDRFIEETPKISDWAFDRWMNWMVQSVRQNMAKEVTFQEIKKKQLELDKKQGDMPGTMSQMREDLKQAGFKEVFTLWKSYVHGIMAALR